MTDLAPRLQPTRIPGLVVLDLVLHDDARGWFKENWHRRKMLGLGLPDFVPVQHNVALSMRAGATRGLHAEPWDKLVSVANGRIFGAWVDLRAGGTFGTVESMELGPGQTVFVPRGVANGYQSLVDETVYSYLVNDHWSADKRSAYGYVNLADDALAIPWPIPLSEATVSDADVLHPLLADVPPMRERATVVVGADGQLGRALCAQFPQALGLRRSDLPLEDAEAFERIGWSQVGVILNAAAYTNVDAAETPVGRRLAWESNVTGLARLCRIADEHRITMVHISSDYVFDGTVAVHDEDEPPSPLGVYGQTKAAGDALVSQVPRHYVVRTSWVIGEGRNFVSTMADLAAGGVCPKVVNDQYGRLTFTDDIASAIHHLLDVGAPYGTYNVTGEGPVQSWADIARDVFDLCGRSRSDVTPVSSDEYAALSPDDVSSPRPQHSALSLDRIKSTGFRPANAVEQLGAYVGSILGSSPAAHRAGG